MCSAAFRYLNMNYGLNAYLMLLGTGANVYQALYQGNVFGVAARRAMWTIGAELEGRISGAFGLLFNLQYRGYDVKKIEDQSAHIGLPNLTAGLALKYNYRINCCSRPEWTCTDRAISTSCLCIRTGRARLPDWAGLMWICNSTYISAPNTTFRRDRRVPRRA